MDAKIGDSQQTLYDFIEDENIGDNLFLEEEIERSQGVVTDEDDTQLGSSPIQNPGGIDFNPDYLNIESQGNKVEMPIPNNSQQFQNIEIKGLVPFIFNITPITNIPIILGKYEKI